MSLTWLQAKPKIVAEIDGIKTALVSAEPHIVPKLQARCQTLIDLIAWFEKDKPDETIGDADTY